MESVDVYKRPSEVNYLDLHTQNFSDAIKKNDPTILNTPIESGSVAAINAQMGNIAFKTGHKVSWDASTKMFKDDDEANKLIMAKYNNEWKLPTS
jgi:hypothetical protein